MKPNMAAAQFAVSQKKNLAGCVLTMTMLQEEFVGYFAQIAIVGNNPLNLGATRNGEPSRVNPHPKRVSGISQRPRSKV